MGAWNAIAQLLDPLVESGLGGAPAMVLVLLFVAVFLGVLGTAGLVGPDPVRRRLLGGTARDGRAEGATPVLLSGKQATGRWDGALALLQGRPFGTRRTGPSRLRMRLLQAGFPGPNAVRIYVVLRTLVTLGTPLAVLGPLAALDTVPSVEPMTLWSLGLLLAGFAAPERWLRHRLQRRHRAIRAGFPEALDMMVVCVEAGLGLDATLSRVGRQIAPAHPILSAELELVALQLRAGKDREDALRSLARRTGLREIGSFVTLLVQSDALGTGIAQALRLSAEEMRSARLLRAEELAHKLPVKLTLPLVAFILPAMMAVVLLPGLITIVRDVLPSLGS